MEGERPPSRFEVYGDAMKKYNTVTDSIGSDLKRERKALKAALKMQVRSAGGVRRPCRTADPLRERLVPL